MSMKVRTAWSAEIFRAAMIATQSAPSPRRITVSVAGTLQWESRALKSGASVAPSTMNSSSLLPAVSAEVRARAIANRWFCSRIVWSGRLTRSTPFSVFSKIAWYFLFSRSRWAVRCETKRARAVRRRTRIAAEKMSSADG